MLAASGVGCLALALQPDRQFPSLHTVLDTAIFMLALMLTALIMQSRGRRRDPVSTWVALSFGVVTLLALVHVSVAFDWFGQLAWVAERANLLRPATWPPAVHVLPIGLLCAMSPWCQERYTRVFAAAIVVLGGFLLWAFDQLPRYTEPGWLGMTRPTLALVPLLWATVAVVGWRKRYQHRLMARLALMGAILSPANLLIVYSAAPSDTAAMLAHLGRVAGFLTLLLCVMQLAGDDQASLELAETDLALLNRELEERVAARSAELRRSTERLEAETKDRSFAETRFRAVVENASSGMIMVDQRGKIALVNREAERLFGYPREELLGQSIELLVPGRFHGTHDKDRSSYQAAPVARAMGQGRDLFGMRRDGQEVPIEIGLNPIETAEGTFVLASVVDITQRKDAEQELRRSNEELERFAYVASHDLQEPLRMVGSYVQLLAKRYQGRLDADADEFIGFAVDGAHRMQRLIHDLLAFSRVGSRGAPLQPVEMNDVLLQVLGDMALTIRESGGAVTHAPLPRVQADRTQLAQLLTNLITNALKFHGPAPPLVHLEAARYGPMWQIRVRDNGIGIEPQYFERIFVLFQRLHTREEYSGTGIGLAVARKIVDRHGGRLWVESIPGEGSTFHFTLRAADDNT